MDELDGDLRSYTWQIPCDLATSECKVKIVVYNCASHTATDVSDGTFIVHGVASPTNLTAEAIAEDAIVLQWQDNKENQVSCFKQDDCGVFNTRKLPLQKENPVSGSQSKVLKQYVKDTF
ncbi:MAG: hypothetical protein DRQ06_05780 [Candidatus Hydrothermota bacterium]|nr:MAG: hypothetical protein DRQ06_05780 [Candidatus Hydrothermae bacterium]